MSQVLPRLSGGSFTQDKATGAVGMLPWEHFQLTLSCHSTPQQVGHGGEWKIRGLRHPGQHTHRAQTASIWIHAAGLQQDLPPETAGVKAMRQEQPGRSLVAHRECRRISGRDMRCSEASADGLDFSVIPVRATARL